MKKITQDKNMQVKSRIDKPDVAFFDVDAEPFKVYGVFRDGDRYYRLPKEVAEKVSDGVLDLCSATSGGRIRFVTDSSYVAVRVELDKFWLYSNFALCGVCGLDVYADGVYAGTFRPPIEIVNEGKTTFEKFVIDENGEKKRVTSTANSDTDNIIFESVVELGEKKKRVITVNMPNYSEVKRLFVGVENTAEILSAPSYKYEKPIVYYGSSITMGGCASRPGMSYEAMLSRRLDTNFLNLGFSGLALAEDAMAEYVAGLDMSLFVYDYDYNADDVEHLLKTHERMFKTVRAKNPDLPILMISRPRVPQANDPRFAVIKKTYDNAVARGDKNVYIVRGDTLIAECGMECTVDNVHPTDLGFYLMANGLEPIIKSIIEK